LEQRFSLCQVTQKSKPLKQDHGTKNLNDSYFLLYCDHKKKADTA